MSWEILEGDCIEKMRELDDASIDAIVTDPPYGLEFMGKEWDSFKTYAGGNPNMKPQGQTVQTDRGGDFKAASYGYRSKNPRCRRCGKLQRGNGACKCPQGGDWSYRHDESGFQMQAWHQAWATEALRVLKPGGHLLAFGGTRTYHRLACAIEDAGFEIRDSLIWLYGSGFPKSLDVSKAIDKAAGAEREVVGKSETCVGPSMTEMYGHRDGRNWEGANAITAPATPEAQQWQGWGTALKPSHEPIVVARKPLAGTVAQNVLTHGVGALNIDGCRIEGSWSYPNGPGTGGFTADKFMGQVGRGEKTNPHLGQKVESHPSGRWPANVALSHMPGCGALSEGIMQTDGRAAPTASHPLAECAPGCPVAELDRQSGELTSGDLRPGHKQGDGEGYGYGNGVIQGTYGGDTGGASRFFYTAKSSRAERQAGVGANAHPT